MRRLIFNPVSGKFDYIDVADTSGFAPPVPTHLLAGQSTVLGPRTQMTFTEEIVLDEGAEIFIDEEAVLAHVVTA